MTDKNLHLPANTWGLVTVEAERRTRVPDLNGCMEGFQAFIE